MSQLEAIGRMIKAKRDERISEAAHTAAVTILNDLPDLSSGEEFGEFRTKLVQDRLIRNVFQRIGRGEEPALSRKIECRERKRREGLLLMRTCHSISHESMAQLFLLYHSDPAHRLRHS